MTAAQHATSGQPQLAHSGHLRATPSRTTSLYAHADAPFWQAGNCLRGRAVRDWGAPEATGRPRTVRARIYRTWGHRPRRRSQAAVDAGPRTGRCERLVPCACASWTAMPRSSRSTCAFALPLRDGCSTSIAFLPPRGGLGASDRLRARDAHRRESPPLGALAPALAPPIASATRSRPATSRCAWPRTTRSPSCWGDCATSCRACCRRRSRRTVQSSPNASRAAIMWCSRSPLSWRSALACRAAISSTSRRSS